MASTSRYTSGMATSSDLQTIDLDPDVSGSTGAGPDEPVTPLSTESLEGGAPKKPQAAFEEEGVDDKTHHDVSSRRRNVPTAGTTLGTHGYGSGLGKTASGRSLSSVGFDMDSAPKDRSGQAIESTFKRQRKGSLRNPNVFVGSSLPEPSSSTIFGTSPRVTALSNSLTSNLLRQRSKLLDPYVLVTLLPNGESKRNSFVIGGGCDVDFQVEHLIYKLDKMPASPPQLLFECYHADKIRDAFVGAGVHRTIKEWPELKDGSEAKFYMKLFDEKNKAAGTIKVHITFDIDALELDVYVHSARNLKDIKNNTGNVTDLSQHTDHSFLQRVCVYVVLYFTVGMIYFTSPGTIMRNDGKSVDAIDALYFLVVSVTTTGYGEIVPRHWVARIFTSVYVLVGMGLLGVAAGALSNHLLDSRPKASSIHEAMGKEMAKHKQAQAQTAKKGQVVPSPSGDDDDGSTPTGSNPPPGQGIVRVASTTSGRVVTAHVDRSHDYEASLYEGDDENGPSKLELLRDWFLHKDGKVDTTRSLVQGLLILGVLLLAGTMFFMYEGKRDGSVIYLNEAFYFAVMSATTVGYGDSVPESPGGKLFISIYLIVGCFSLANAVHSIASIPTHMRAVRLENIVLNQYGRDLDPYELRDLCSMPWNEDPSYCNKNEFILGMLLKLNKITVKEYVEIGRRFDALDSDGSGKLTPEDVHDPSALVSRQIA
mmetsp:Transcript_83881/g.237229  ORF Transcript_83881/g.237229 Transcript_83881/m.237229 type:complete len:707 (-) Transcript_83881:60-2180(-)